MDPVEVGTLVTVRTRKVDSLLYLCKGIVTTVYHPDVPTVAVPQDLGEADTIQEMEDFGELDAALRGEAPPPPPQEQ